MDSPTTVDEVVANYIAAVGCRDGAARRELIRRAVSDDVVFSSGSGVFHGRAEFSDELEQVHAKLPSGAVLARSTPIEEHHGRLRFGWCFCDGATGEPFEVPHSQGSYAVWTSHGSAPMGC